MRSVFVFIISLLAVCSATAETLWNKAEIGASVADIAQAFPEGAGFAPSEQQRLTSGAELLYRIEKFDIAGKPFEVKFYFLTGKLTQVALTHRSAEPIYACESVFGSLQEGLHAKYGVELKNTRQGGLGVSRSASWARDRTSISMNMYAYETPSCGLHLTYSNRIAEVADKL